MKKTFLFYSAVFCSLVVSAQTSAQSQQISTGSLKVEKANKTANAAASTQTSSSATLQTTAAADAAAKARGGGETGKEVIAAKKDELKSAGQAGIEKADKLSDKEINVQGSAISSNDVDAGPGRVQVQSTADVNTRTTLSLKKVKDNAIAVKEGTATHIENKTNATAHKTAGLATAAQAKTAGTAKATTAVAASSGTKVATAVKAKPTPVKVKATTVTAAGVKLR